MFRKIKRKTDDITKKPKMIETDEMKRGSGLHEQHQESDKTAALRNCAYQRDEEVDQSVHQRTHAQQE